MSAIKKVLVLVLILIALVMSACLYLGINPGTMALSHDRRTEVDRGKLEVYEQGEVGKGRAMYVSSGCNGCHAIGGLGGTAGPDLTLIAQREDVSWTFKQIKDPRLHKPDARMPGYSSKLTDAEVNEISLFLSTLR
jgi:cbb3-type cytochrome oxidase cytochrome c subunit